MADAPPSAVGRADGERLLAELRAINEEVRVAALEMERLAGIRTAPDGAAIAAARLRFSRSLRGHLRHVDSTILPWLRTTVDARFKPAIDDYRRLLHDYHEAAAHHVARWPSTNVAADWDGYRHSVADMLVRLRARVAVEQGDIHPLLARSRNG